ncbi:hypothetical protein [Tunicatimonas pelagia]|uniref:hypothetical protein n=1 Tax=Tunicatimonas pelagia TaxID=931531 RepID=UPI00266509A1|nr:hypothetical protein [Tunicatimonas pelagia]WKN42118.1 hypothetical protein P0M28_24080 [Tunicatimonas pelagia]
MHWIQIPLFKQKSDFDHKDFECSTNQEVFKLIAQSCVYAFDEFATNIKPYYDRTTRSNMLNNSIVAAIQERCRNNHWIFHEGLNGNKRSYAILSDKYILFFKKDPVSNIKTKQDDIIKQQGLDKHVLFLVYHVDEFWNSLQRIEFQYLISSDTVVYAYDITHLATEETVSIRHEEEIVNPIVGINESEVVKPRVRVKPDRVSKKKIGE